jgi:hypothetical protein
MSQEQKEANYLVQKIKILIEIYSENEQKASLAGNYADALIAQSKKSVLEDVLIDMGRYKD